MKKSKKIISLFLVSVMVISMFAVSAIGVHAVPAPPRYGDVNGNWDVDMEDVLIIQKHIAKLLTLSGIQKTMADVDGNNEITMEDVLLVQKYVAKSINTFPVEDFPSKGTTEIIKDSEYVQLENHHTTIVYLPPDYSEDKEYPVLYAHDGQNLFYAETGYLGQYWELLDTLDKLITEGTIEPVIVVGVYNNGANRVYEYCPSQGGEAYLSYIMDTVKPYIDTHYSTKQGPEHTGIMGSSMGGLISLYAGMKYDNVFGKAGVVSPAILYDEDYIFDYIGNMEQKVDTKFWIDAGTSEDPHYTQNARVLVDMMLSSDYTPVDDFLYYEVPRATHSEKSWAERAHMILLYLFGTEELNPVDIDLLTPVSTGAVGSSIFPVPAILCENDVIYTPVWELLVLDETDLAVLENGNEILCLDEGTVTVRYTALEKTVSKELTIIPSGLISVTFNVTVPENTPKNATVHMCGSLPEMGQWQDGLAAEMNKVDDTHYTLTLDLPVGTSGQYKYLLNNSWGQNEVNADGSIKADRQFTAENTFTVDDSVIRWSGV